MSAEDVRDKSMEELRERIAQQEQESERQRHAERQLDLLAAKLLTVEAKARLSNVKLVNQELYLKAVQALLYLYQSGSVQEKISEEALKGILEKLGSKRETRIRRK